MNLSYTNRMTLGIQFYNTPALKEIKVFTGFSCKQYLKSIDYLARVSNVPPQLSVRCSITEIRTKLLTKVMGVHALAKYALLRRFTHRQPRFL